MLYISLYAVILGWDVCHTEWCFSQAELMASLGNMSLLETAEPREGRSLRQSCLMYMAFINAGEKYTNWTQRYMLCMLDLVSWKATHLIMCYHILIIL